MSIKINRHLETTGILAAFAIFVGLQLWSSLGSAVALKFERASVKNRIADYQATLSRLSARRLPLPSLPENTFATGETSEQMLSFQARLGVLARQAKINLELLRAEQANSFSPGTQTVPVTVRARGDLQAFTEFMALLESEQPSVFVDHIQITPTGRDNPDTRLIIQMHLLRLIKSEAAL